MFSQEAFQRFKSLLILMMRIPPRGTQSRLHTPEAPSVKEPGSRCDIEQQVRAAHGVRPSSDWPMTSGLDRASLALSDAEPTD